MQSRNIESLLYMLTMIWIEIPLEAPKNLFQLPDGLPNEDNITKS